MSASEKPEPSRIAIKFGGSSSGPGKNSSRVPPSSSLGKRQRPTHTLGDNSDSESEDESRANGRHERITAFGADGAELEKSEQDRRDNRDRAKRGPLTIERQPNRDWRSEARARNRRDHQRDSRQGNRQQQASAESEDADRDKPMKWGLTITKSASPSKEEARDGKVRDMADKTERVEPDEKGSGEGEEDANARTEREAVEALMGQTTNDRTGTRLVIERAVDNPTEDDVFQRDFRDAPDASTLEEYEAMPVEEFGAALLRGMGWDGKDRGPKVKQVVRRPNQLGLGAKELKGAEDLGAWNHKSGGGSSSSNRQRPPRLHEYRRDEEKRKEKREERYRESYKAERDRERDNRRSNGHHSSSSSSHHHSRHHR